MKYVMLALFMVGLFLFLNGTIQFAHFSFVEKESAAYHIGQILGSAIKPFAGIALIILTIRKFKFAEN